ncbi:MAG: hypothetical protein IKB01_07500 [Lachnospiraceae bacterium]|nr:hypothetical protein [Lachnospiraceae bacterium]
MKICIVTNMTPTENYTPSLFKDEVEAKKWMRECAANNILSAFKEKLEDEIYDEGHNLITDDAERLYDIILEYANRNIDGVDVYEDRIDIYYGNDSCNVLQLFREVEV